MEALLPFILKTVLGAGGGYLGNMLKSNGLGMIGNLVAGGVGGNLLPLVLGMLGMGGAADATDGSAFSLANIAGGLLGGGAGSLIGGLFKKA
jgi:hypothetical protein